MNLYPSSKFTDSSARVVEFVASLLPEALVEEVGSTAIPGAITKGDIDIFVGVERDHFQFAIDMLSASGYRIKVDTPQTDELRMMESEQQDIDVACQVVILGSQYDFFRQFRDRLNAEPALVEAYNALKRANAQNSHEQYRVAKAAFVEKVLGVD